MSETLTPKLKALDKRVLGMLPVSTSYEQDDVLRAAGACLSAHQIAERLATDDVADIRRTLQGLTHLGYAQWCTSRRQGRPNVYWAVTADRYGHPEYGNA